MSLTHASTNKSTFLQILSEYASSLDSLEQAMAQCTVLFPVHAIREYSILQLRKVQYDDQDMASQLDSIESYLNSDVLDAYRTGDSLKVNIFLARRVEKSILMGTPLDWLNVGDKLSHVKKLTQDAATYLSDLSSDIVPTRMCDDWVMFSLAFKAYLIDYVIPRCERIVLENFYQNTALVRACESVLPTLKVFAGK